MKEVVIHRPKWKKLKNTKGWWVMLSKPKRDPDGRKDKKKKKSKKAKKDQGKGQNEDFLGSWIGQKPRKEKGGSS